MLVAGGADPGFAKGAIAAVGRDGSRLTLLHRQLIITKPKQPRLERFRTIWLAYGAMIREHKVRVFGIEDQSGVSTAGRMQAQRAAKAIARGMRPPKASGFNANNDSVLAVVGIAMGAAFAYGASFTEIHPKTIKLGVCGKGGHNAGKSEVIAAVKMLFPELRDEDISEHEADAIAAAVCVGRQALWDEAVSP